MTAILGLSAFYHDSAAAIVVDGEIVAAAQEERFTRKKHDEGFPKHAIDFCLTQAGLTSDKLDYVVFYEKPFLKFERLLETYLSFAPAGYKSFVKALPQWLKAKLHLPREMREGLGGAYRRKFVFTGHHESHAASAFFPSPHEEAAIMTLDGVGEWATATIGKGHGNRIELLRQQNFPHSLGLLYSAFTYYCGFKVNSGEYKLMGLAPYGEPRFAKTIREHLIDLKPDGSFRLDLSYFNYCQGLTMTGPKFHALFGGPPRDPESLLDQRHMDLAASVQQVTEEAMLATARHAHELAGRPKNLCMAGGVALNCVGNGVLLREGPFENIWIQPASGDAGGALGAALFTWYQLLNKPRTAPVDAMKAGWLGPSFGDAEIRAFLDGQGGVYRHYSDDGELCRDVAKLIADGNVIGWFQGRMEYGPRALGARSIIGDARNPEMQTTMNLKIKFRESFRPFAPVVLRERVHEYFETRPNEDSPYMLQVAPVRVERRRAVAPEDAAKTGIEKLKLLRSDVPAITHVDYSARIQTVDAERHGRYYQLLKEFDRLTGCPVLINTSFNVRGEPIVCRPSEAWECFRNTNIDVLVLERFVLLKSAQKNMPAAGSPQYLAKFAKD